MSHNVSRYVEVINEKTTIKPKNYLEIGARDKINADFICKQFNIEPGYVHLIEPHPVSYKTLKQKSSYYIHKLAFSNESGKKSFYALEKNVGVSSLTNRKDDFYEKTGYQKITTDVVTARQFMSDQSIDDIDMCKIDVEGHSYEVIEGFGASLRNVKILHVECETREIWQNQKTYEDVRDYLSSLGMKCLDVINVNGHTVQLDSIWTWPEYIKG